MTRAGVLVMAFGGPVNLDEVGPFMRRLMGREPSSELVDEVRLRYLTIGGASPLPDIARAIAEALAARLKELGHDVPVVLGMRYSAPFISDAFDMLEAAGVERVVALSLSPFESRVSSGAYREAVAEAAKLHPDMEVVEADAYHSSPAFMGIFADACSEARTALREGLAALAEPKTGRVLTVFTAHSLPEEDLADDPYVDQLKEVVHGVAERNALGEPVEDAEVPFMPGVRAYGLPDDPDPWILAYQSKGRKPGDWLGPEVGDVVKAAADAGFSGVAVCPVGFVADHMETLYDLDVVAAGTAFDEDMEFTRAKVPNDAPAMMGVLAEAVAAHLK